MQCTDECGKVMSQSAFGRRTFCTFAALVRGLATVLAARLNFLPAENAQIHTAVTTVPVCRTECVYGQSVVCFCSYGGPDFLRDHLTLQRSGLPIARPAGAVMTCIFRVQAGRGSCSEAGFAKLTVGFDAGEIHHHDDSLLPARRMEKRLSPF
ncbi:hypothetical protein F5Y15DRAFT_334442 [Xylariaceae sp. FL0016]|nr:hypothetical protein F5Y15DRAFT_334442 [Xylariaceae sp. FL0016]